MYMILLVLLLHKNYNTLSGLKQHPFIIASFHGLEVCYGMAGSVQDLLKVKSSWRSQASFRLAPISSRSQCVVGVGLRPLFPCYLGLMLTLVPCGCSPVPASGSHLLHRWWQQLNRSHVSNLPNFCLSLLSPHNQCSLLLRARVCR